PGGRDCPGPRAQPDAGAAVTRSRGRSWGPRPAAHLAPHASGLARRRVPAWGRGGVAAAGACARGGAPSREERRRAAAVCSQRPRGRPPRRGPARSPPGPQAPRAPAAPRLPGRRRRLCHLAAVSGLSTFPVQAPFRAEYSEKRRSGVRRGGCFPRRKKLHTGSCRAVTARAGVNTQKTSGRGAAARPGVSGTRAGPRPAWAARRDPQSRTRPGAARTASFARSRDLGGPLRSGAGLHPPRRRPAPSRRSSRSLPGWSNDRPSSSAAPALRAGQGYTL
ncbi:PREDICTED: translation initiation factor IF-2-like, partial [Chinchilla lanigera]|uniref:translation initiation factor IF-2-like n=1 Tax=Chinchilla lanigera TaxID=34839 RepID=UPI000698D79E